MHISPRLLSSDDSAVGSSSTSYENSSNHNNDQMDCQSPDLNAHDQRAQRHTLATGEKCDKAFMLRRLVRTELPHLNGQQYVSKSCRSIKFQSKGRLDGSRFVPRPMSMLWPDSESSTISELQRLDNYLVETNFVLNPVEWMLANDLTSKPTCQECSTQMILTHKNDSAIWHCPVKFNEHCALVQRPSCFKGIEELDITRLLFSIYHWSISSPFEYVLEQMKLDSKTAFLIWQRLQKVCMLALEKSYPRYRLYSNPNGSSGLSEPIDLIFIKLNKMRIICAKHPKSNGVRLGRFNQANSYQTWFAHGAQIRICQSRFLDLKKTRVDLEIKLVPLAQMVLKDGQFDQDSAFGYMLSLLTNALKEFDTSTLSEDSIRYLLAEAEWREFYGNTPYDAFKNLVHHISQYYRPKLFHFAALQAALGSGLTDSEQRPAGQLQAQVSTTVKEPPKDPESVFVENYYYATIEPIDEKDGRLLRQPDEHYVNMPPSDVTFLCHLCNIRYESFDFGWHLIAHIEEERRGKDRRTLTNRGLMECKHCFRVFNRKELIDHRDLMKMEAHRSKFGCRICCLQFIDETQFMRHMTKFHVGYETPYKCSSCYFASSFQREVFVHFQEEHRQDYIILCPICLRGFTVAEPGRLNTSMSRTASQKIYEHLSKHYTLGSSFSCDSCCLSFLQASSLKTHKDTCHQPPDQSGESTSCIHRKLIPYKVRKDEEEYCVVAKFEDLRDAEAQSIAARNELQESSYDSLTETYTSDSREQTPSCHGSEYLTTNEITEGLLQLHRSSDFIQDGFVVLTPNEVPAKCVECMEYVTDMHYKSTMRCRYCPYKTHCPQAADNHHVLKHPEHSR